eukprot:TRINITY_DN17324_c0_g1_i1.p1 TRINITY_DN17324_c0_g1~~TRINITY_DN17324_c0_g1_i1.p1  ORF type:complete len:459 (+),score=115.53 TRINITY_DN17324_c0_g1_i1:38-1414(+)
MGCCGAKEKEITVIPKFSSIRDEKSRKNANFKKDDKTPLLKDNKSEVGIDNEDEEQIKEKLIIHNIKLKSDTKRNKIIEEILKTEQSYVNSLVVFAERILKPLIEEWGKPVQKQTLLELRNKIEAVYVVNYTLLDQLEEIGNKGNLSDNVGEVFKKLIPFLKMYSEYTICYEKTLPFISKITVDPSFIKFYSNLRETFKEIKLDFSSYSIVPVQRIPRYELLLRELLKETPNKHKDYKPIEYCLEQVKGVANFVNQSITKAKNLIKMVEIQEKLLFKNDLIDPHRVFIKEGILILQKSDDKRMFWLFNDKFISAKPIFGGGLINKYVDCEEYMLSVLKLDPMENDESYFQISTVKKNYIVKPENKQEKAEWVTALQEALDKDYISRKSFGNNISTLNKKDGKDCSVCKKSFSALKRKKRHCKNCENVVCDGCSSKLIIASLDEKKKKRVCDLCAKDIK